MFDTPFPKQERQQIERNALRTWLIGLDESKSRVAQMQAEFVVRLPKQLVNLSLLM